MKSVVSSSPSNLHVSQSLSTVHCPLSSAFASGTPEVCHSWQSQMRQRICSLDALAKRFPEMHITPEMRQAEQQFPMAITPYYASLIEKTDFSDPIFRQCVPSSDECYSPEWLSSDPLGELPCSPAHGLVHRYPDRALLIATSACPAYCRHCTRKRVSSQADTCITNDNLDACVDYLARTPVISDVLISGGDPLTLSDTRIDEILSRIRSVTSVKVIRIATRTLVNLPMRITPELVDIFKKHAPIYVNTHFNHPREVTPQAIEAANRLSDAGIIVGNQTVLLHGVNDDAETIETLCRTLFHNRIRPYYLFQCDLIGGIEHLRTPLQLGIDIMKHLRGRLSGLAIPNFAVDTPGHGGKVELLPQAILETRPDGTLLENNRGEAIFYPNPSPER